MGHTLLQIGRVIFAAFWFVFILIAINMALAAWATAPNWLTTAFFAVAAYAGLGMMMGLVARFNKARELQRVRYY